MQLLTRGEIFFRRNYSIRNPAPKGEQRVKNRLRELRLARGLTQAVLAERSGISESTIARIDATPTAEISLRFGRKLAAALSCDPFELLPETNVPRRLPGESTKRKTA
jgi:transcriptional regulator with XRE-family HTH domain